MKPLQLHEDGGFIHGDWCLGYSQQGQARAKEGVTGVIDQLRSRAWSDLEQRHVVVTAQLTNACHPLAMPDVSPVAGQLKESCNT